MRSRLLRTLTALALVVVVAACGGGEQAPSTTVPPPATTATTSKPAETTTTPAPTTSTTTIPLPVATEDFTAMVEKVRSEVGVPAMGGALVTRDGIRGIGVSGVRRVGVDTPVTLDDNWHIGSMLKSITGLLAGIAVDEGVITWDTTVGEAYPDLTVGDAWTDVTLSDLMAMRSGMASWTDNITGTTAREQRDSIVARALVSTPEVPFGTFYYSNMAYVVAGSMIERAMGANYEDLLVEKIGNPLGATGIGFGPQNTAGEADQTVPHTLSGDSWTPQDNWDNPPGLSSAGRAHMPLESWALIIQEFLRAAAGEGTLVSEETAAYLFTGITPDAAGDKYAIGWTSTSRPWDRKVATHAGSNTGNYAVAWLGLDHGVAFLATMNAGYSNGGDNGHGDQLIGEILGWWTANR